MFRWREGQQEAVNQANIRRGITSSFARALKVLQQKHLQCREDEFVYSNDASNNLCSSLESAFLHGLKDSVTQKLTAYVGLTATQDQSVNMNFWSVVIKFTHSDVVTQLQKLTQINTEIGLCRAWVRLALNDGLMESYLHSILVDSKTLRYFYHSYSYLRDHEQPGILKNFLTGLMSLEFKLSCNSSVLNIWNTTTLQLTGALETQNTPSPAIGQSEMGQSDSVQHRNNSQEQDLKIDQRSVPAKHAETSSNARNISMSASMQNVGDLQKDVSAFSGDHISSLPYSASVGSFSSRVSCPDPGLVTVTEPSVCLSATEPSDKTIVLPTVDNTQANLNILPDKFHELTFPDVSVEDGCWTSSEDQITQKTACQSDDTSGSGLKPHVILEESQPLHSTSSPTRPRSRRVDEEDMKQILSSSFSPAVDPQKSDSAHYENILSDDHHDRQNTDSTYVENIPSYEHHDIVYRASSPLSDALSDSGIVQKLYISPESSTSLDHAAIEKQELEFQSVYQDTQQTDDDYNQKNKDHEEMSPSVNLEQVEYETVVKRTQKGRSSIINQKNSKDHQQPRGSGSSSSRESEQHSQIIESAEEAVVNMAEHSHVPSKQDKDLEEANPEIEISISPSRYGNSLNSMSGWSSEIESKGELRKQTTVDRSRVESFASMLQAYTPAASQQSHTAATLSEVIETLPCDTEGESLDGGSAEICPPQEEVNVQWEDLGMDNFEVLKSPSELFCGQVEANSFRMFFLFHVPREHGLSHQNFACKGCFRQIGMIYGQPRLCEFDGGLYCYGCHENSEAYIPSSILFDWDFRKKKVCQENYKFLLELEEQALYDIEEHNPKLYNHVPELQELKILRQQLVYLKSYLFACSQKVAESMRQKVWPREHIYERRDLYSVMDFLQVQSGSLQRLVKELVKVSAQHVYDCVLCSLKGFVCEICRNPQVIYPFEVDTTIRCETCKAVYHKTCMTESLPCPKCERWGRHISSSNINEYHPEDYGMSPQT